MTTRTGQNVETLWNLLLVDGRSCVIDALDALARDPSVEAETSMFIRAKLFDLEASSWYCGAELLAEATRILRRTLQGPLPSAEKTEELLFEGMHSLQRILSAMAAEHPDEKEILADLEYFESLKKDLADQTSLESNVTTSGHKDRQDSTNLSEDAWIPNVTADMLPAFFEECSERLESLSEKLLELEDSPDDRELLSALFRDLHTIKGSSAFVGLTYLNSLAHKAEDLVGELRDGKRRADGRVIDALLSAKDTMTTILERAAQNKPLSELDMKPLLDMLNNPSDRAFKQVVEADPEPGSEATRSKPEQVEGKKVPGPATIRVGFEKLDVLLNLVGELVLDKASVRSVLQNLDSAAGALETIRKSLYKYIRLSKQKQGSVLFGEIRAVYEEMDRIARLFKTLVRELDMSAGSLDFVSCDLRDQVMGLRMVPISQVFTKHKRTIRDLARILNKKVALEIEGQETELDKMLVEKLDEPILHLVRNAVDHGIEDPETRARHGKNREGKIVLSARHQGGQLIVEVTDDGKGLDPESIRQNAIKKGLLKEEEAYEIDGRSLLRLIFAPGFSTANKVTHISGRGVGMDVVHDAVRRLRGSIDVNSVPGKFTTLTISLPLTLAIRHILLMRIGGELLALPLDHVVRTFSLNEAAVNIVGSNPVIEEGKTVLPLINVGKVLRYAPEDGFAGKKVVCVNFQGRYFGILCDSLEGQHEIVVKTMGDLLANVDCAAGTTLFGERVVIILDLPALIKRWEQGEEYKFTPQSRIPFPTGHVLVVEDSPPTRTLIRELFQNLGFRVTEASDGLEALEAVKTEHFDLVSTDVRMPHMDGYLLAKNLRKNPSTQSVPILMISALGEQIDKVRGFDAGIDLYLVKPVEPSQLHEAVSKLLGEPFSGDKP